MWGWPRWGRTSCGRKHPNPSTSTQYHSSCRCLQPTQTFFPLFFLSYVGFVPVSNLVAIWWLMSLVSPWRVPNYFMFWYSKKWSTSLVSLLSLQKINNILSRKSLSCSRSLWIHYLGKMMALKVKLTFYPTLLSLWITAMPSIKALGAA